MFPLTIINISRHTQFFPPKRKKFCTTEHQTQAPQPPSSSHHCNGLKEDIGQRWITAFLHPSTDLYAMIKNCILPIDVLALTAGLESKSFCLAAVLPSPVSGFANHVNNSCSVKKHFVISVNSKKRLC